MFVFQPLLYCDNVVYIVITCKLLVTKHRSELRGISTVFTIYICRNVPHDDDEDGMYLCVSNELPLLHDLKLHKTYTNFSMII